MKKVFQGRQRNFCYSIRIITTLNYNRIVSMLAKNTRIPVVSDQGNPTIHLFIKQLIYTL